MSELFFKQTYSPLTSEQLVSQVKRNMDEERFNHCVRVSQMARELAKLNHYDENKAAVAGLVHDYAKQVPVSQYQTVIKTQNFDPDLLNWNRAIWHGIVGTYFIERDLKITDPEILTAVKRHTTGDVQMTTLDKIVFMADYIEPGRHFAGVEQAREVTYQNLDNGVGYQLAHTLTFLIENRNKIYPRTFKAYNVWSVKKD
ncbi:bis(5'-nucleosyl)-tetraphosphatase (symmetrical) YqeK [Lactobacillus sp. ESL0681]|uniref:bis(5'-nucleosyl)-tetraphosphatase (symmetrical) YqeK n=1 Tax=Lactobacillus sp. ESL0681 TaxID=2983211 RepID=UPI0023F6A28F|nr:bis(5'-nucleosyl)-tetraphosphatase (symmetrical) YqeK [Lactobacillus sp. ESL0681]WEV40931.1 bis(5'-nucleosyl)-tetraphosphatase (symmetrical) YqeK [Lactobacillus sp. ESL0681]